MQGEEKVCLNSQEAYFAMFKFLERYYENTGSQEIGGLLGSMAISSDGLPMDSALWEEWLEAIAQAASEVRK